MQLYRALQGYPGDRLMVIGATPDPSAALLPCRYDAVRLATYRLACTRIRRVTSGLNALNTLLEPQLGRTVQLAREFKPDVVVTVMDQLSYYKHAWALASRLRVPLLTITMDDPQTFETAHPLLEWAFVRFLRRIYRETALSLGVSHEMCAYLHDTFGRQSEVMYFGPVDGLRPRPVQESTTLRHPPKLTLGYTGSLSLGYRAGLESFANSLQDSDTILNVYTRDQHNFLSHPNIVNRGHFPADVLWPRVQEECDGLLLPYAFEGPIRRVYRTHFPTKLSEYCWSGLPLLLVGPNDATGIRWGLRNPQAALVCDSLDLPRLTSLLRRLAIDGELRRSLAAAATRIAQTDFAPDAARHRFFSYLVKAAGRPTRSR